MPRSYVKPYVKRQKNNAADAEAMRDRDSPGHALRRGEEPRAAALIRLDPTGSAAAGVED
jgi:hypothetical protein